jgi:putative two-component system response regulator
VAVADVFDALSIQRPYKQAWPIPKVLQVLDDMKQDHLDARFVDLFINNLPDFLEIRALWNEQEKRDSNVSNLVELYSKDRIA